MQAERHDLGVVGRAPEKIGVDAARVRGHVDRAEGRLVLREPRRARIRAVRGAVAVHVLVLHGARDFQRVLGVDTGQAHRGLVVGEVVLVIERVAHVAVFARVVAGNTQREILAGCDVRGTLEREATPLADIDFNDAVRRAVKRRALGVDAECAAYGIAAEQEALWAAQDFRALEVVKARHDGAVTALVEIILEECG